VAMGHNGLRLCAAALDKLNNSALTVQRWRKTAVIGSRDFLAECLIEALKKKKKKRGMAKIEFYNIDCIEFMKTKPDGYYDLAIVDPPYGLGDKLTSGGTWSVKWQDKGADWDKAPSKEYWEQLFRVSKNWIVFGGNYFIEYLPNCRNFIAWHKPYMDGMHSMS